MCANRKMMVVIVALMGWFAMTGVGFADFIGDSGGVTVTATAGSWYDAVSVPEHLVDGSGMTPSSPVVMASTTGNADGGQGMWLSAGIPASAARWLLFTFSNPVSMHDMVIWNHNQYIPNLNLFQRGLKDVDISYSTGSDETGLGNAFFSGQLQCATGSPTQVYTDDLSAPGGVVDNVKAVKLVYSSNWNGGDYYGLSEVRFVGAVPEPSAVLMAITGMFGLLAYAWRKRK